MTMQNMQQPGDVARRPDGDAGGFVCGKKQQLNSGQSYAGQFHKDQSK